VLGKNNFEREGLSFEIEQEAVMGEKIKSEMISRRQAFSLVGLAAAASLAVPAA